MTTNSLSSHNRDNTTQSLVGFNWRRKSLWKAALCNIYNESKDGGKTRSQACPPLSLVHESSEGSRPSPRQEATSPCWWGEGFLPRASFFSQGLTISPIKWSTSFLSFRICPFDQLRALLSNTGIVAIPRKGRTLLLEWMNSLGGRSEPEVWGSPEAMEGR